MHVVNSYIFIHKKEENKQNTIKLGEYFPTIFNNYFKTNHNNDIEEIKEKINSISFNSRMITGDFKYNKVIIKYKILNVDSVYYLDIIIDNTKTNIISSVTNLNNIFLTDKIFNKNYIPIILYDFASEDYCNKVYPILNKFERKFRKLLFLIFTSNFKELYFEKMAPEKMIEDVKGVIKRKKGKNNEEYRIQNYLYSIDIGTLREFLFSKQWTFIEEEKKNEFLKEDFSKMTKKEISDAINEIEPKSNWERFFCNKGFSNDIEDIMKSINDLRNIVAHNKIMNKEDYLLLRSDLNKLIKEIDKAIKITESVDFIKINNEKNTRLFTSINKTISNLMDQLSINEYTKTLDWFKGYFDTLLTMQNSIMDNYIRNVTKDDKKNK